MFSVCLPPQIPVTAKTMNYALVVFLLSSIIICVLYYKWGRKHFQLPQVDKASIAEEMGTLSVISVDQPPPLAMDVPQQKDDLPDDESPTGNMTTADTSKVNDPPVKNDS